MIRRWDSSDSISELTSLLHRAYGPLAERGLRYVASHQDDATTIDRMTGGATFVFAEGPTLMGTVTVHHPVKNPDCAHYRDPTVAVMEMLAVDPIHQKRGIGSRLIARAEEHARSMGARQMSLDTSERATQLIALYESKGYAIVDRLTRTVVNYSSVVLSKRL